MATPKILVPGLHFEFSSDENDISGNTADGFIQGDIDDVTLREIGIRAAYIAYGHLEHPVCRFYFKILTPYYQGNRNLDIFSGEALASRLVDFFQRKHVIRREKAWVVFKESNHYSLSGGIKLGRCVSTGQARHIGYLVGGYPHA